MADDRNDAVNYFFHTTNVCNIMVFTPQVFIFLRNMQTSIYTLFVFYE